MHDAGSSSSTCDFATGRQAGDGLYLQGSYEVEPTSNGKCEGARPHGSKQREIGTPPRQLSGGSLTREQFLLHEGRIVADLKTQGLTDDEILDLAKRENIFQYPTKKEIRSKTVACLRRVNVVGPRLAELLAHGTPMQAAQVNLYAMMRVYHLMLHFMMDEIAVRFSELNYSISQTDIHAFLSRYQDQYVEGDGWTDATVKRLKSLLVNILVQAEYLESNKSTDLRTVLLDFDVEEGIRANGDEKLLCAFGSQYPFETSASWEADQAMREVS